MQRTSIKSSIPTLRPGDVITNLACGECADKQILVLERHQTDCTFDFSMRDHSLRIVKDPKGPFRWHASMNTFVDNDGRPDDHINRDSVVFQGAGMTELKWYRDLPQLNEAPFLISLEALTGSVDRAQLAKIDAVVARIHGHKGRLSAVTNSMQQAVMLALGNAEVSEGQMRSLLVVINSYLADAVRELEKRSATDALTSALARMFDDMGGFGDDMDMAFGERGSVPRQRRPAHAG